LKTLFLRLSNFGCFGECTSESEKFFFQRNKQIIFFNQKFPECRKIQFIFKNWEEEKIDSDRKKLQIFFAGWPFFMNPHWPEKNSSFDFSKSLLEDFSPKGFYCKKTF